MCYLYLHVELIDIRFCGSALRQVVAKCDTQANLYLQANGQVQLLIFRQA